jgi:membrane dipeptidase
MIVARSLALAAALMALGAPSRADDSPPVVDLHVDLPFQVHYHDRPRSLRRPGGQVSRRALLAGNVRGLVLSLFVPTGLVPRVLRYEELLAVLDTTDGIVRANEGLLAPPRRFTGPLPEAGGPVRVVYAVEGSQPIAGHLDRIPDLVRRGVVLFGPVHAHHDALADSSGDAHPGRGGLTREGEEFVRAVYAAGALVDVSHASDEAFHDIAALARAAGEPLVASHSNARALCPHPRNLTDDQLRAIAASGGIAGVNFHAPFLRADRRPARIADVVRHALHMRSVMGPGHVAIGSDLDGEIRAAGGLGSHAGIPELGRRLQAAGLPASEVAGILGGNAWRVLGGG